MTPTRLGIRVPVGADSPDFVRDMGNAAGDLDSLIARILGAQIQAGRLDDASFKGTPNGVAMQVTIAAGVYFVKDDGLTYSELVPIFRPAATVMAIAASNATNPRVDQIVANTDGSLAVLTGTPTAGATLDNRLGTPALGLDQERLYDLLVPAASTGTTLANLRDRRAWARGAFGFRVKFGGSSSITTSSATPAVMDASFFSLRLELSGTPIRYKLRGRFFQATAGNPIIIDPRVDGVASASGSEPGSSTLTVTPSVTSFGDFRELESIVSVATPDPSAGASSAASGSHLIQPWWSSSSGTLATMSMGANDHGQLEIEEDLRAYLNNGTS